MTAAIAKEHRKPRTRQPQARGQGEREEFCVESELDALIPLLPTETVSAMLGGGYGGYGGAVPPHSKMLHYNAITDVPASS